MVPTTVMNDDSKEYPIPDNNHHIVIQSENDLDDEKVGDSNVVK